MATTQPLHSRLTGVIDGVSTFPRVGPVIIANVAGVPTTIHPASYPCQGEGGEGHVNVLMQMLRINIP
jgi:hypothetical protein